MFTRKYGRTLVAGEQVKVYQNLNKNCFSIVSKRTDRVHGYADSVTLGDVQFIVQPGGREQARRTGRRNVHAYAVGTLLLVEKNRPDEANQEARYNPFEHDTFIDRETSESLHNCRLVHLQDRRLFYS